MLVLLVLTLLCGLGVGLARGGTLGALARVQVFRPWLFAAVVGVLAVGQLVPVLHSPAWIVAAVLAALFASANNRLPGLGLLVTGIIANAAVITVNGGQMPVSLWGADRAGVPVTDILTSSFHRPAGDGTSLRLLGDIIPLPFPWMPAVVSVGDVAIAAGLGLFGAVTPVRAWRTLQTRRHVGPAPGGRARHGHQAPGGEDDPTPDSLPEHADLAHHLTARGDDRTLAKDGDDGDQGDHGRWEDARWEDDRSTDDRRDDGRYGNGSHDLTDDPHHRGDVGGGVGRAEAAGGNGVDDDDIHRDDIHRDDIHRDDTEDDDSEDDDGDARPGVRTAAAGRAGGGRTRHDGAGRRASEPARPPRRRAGP